MEGYRKLSALPDPITTRSRVMPYTPNTTQSSTQGLQDASVQRFMLPLTPVSSAQTSSNTQRLEESLSSESPDSWITAALDELRETLAKKNDDYRIDGEFSNFQFAAKIAETSTLDAILTQIGIKLGRLQGLRNTAWVSNESIMDTYKDLAGYAVILYAYSLYRWEPKKDFTDE